MSRHYCPVCYIYYSEDEYDDYLTHIYNHDNHPYEEASSR